MTPLCDVLRLIEYTFKINGHPIYTALGINQKNYSAWRTGRRKKASIETYEKFREKLGIDLYQSQQKGEIVIVNRQAYESCGENFQLLPKKRNKSRSIP
ncbi:hypothetical protein CK934_09505 [Chitinophaga sp. MD30]|nr:hypothetical protein CK934_09505 [Chitinophaga sp. MD30]